MKGLPESVFKSIVFSQIIKASKDLHERISRRFDIAPLQLIQWARGDRLPLPALQRQVLDFIISRTN